MGKEFVRATVAFLTNDLPLFEPVACRASSGGRSVPADSQDGSGSRLSDDGLRVLSRNAAEGWHATVRSVPSLSSRAGSACQRLGVPVRLVKHVSDQADASALDWPAVVDASPRVLGEWVADHAEQQGATPRRVGALPVASRA